MEPERKKSPLRKPSTEFSKVFHPWFANWGTDPNGSPARQRKLGIYPHRPVDRRLIEKIPKPVIFYNRLSLNKIASNGKSRRNVGQLLASCLL